MGAVSDVKSMTSSSCTTDADRDVLFLDTLCAVSNLRFFEAVATAGATAADDDDDDDDDDDNDDNDNNNDDVGRGGDSESLSMRMTSSSGSGGFICDSDAGFEEDMDGNVEVLDDEATADEEEDDGSEAIESLVGESRQMTASSSSSS
jgi:hypothetical protein